MNLSPYQREFVSAMREAAGRICPEFGIPPQVCVAQSVLETGWGGAHKPSAKGKTFEQFGASTGWNLWGIKGKGDSGSQNWSTKEYLGVKPNGKWVTIVAAFAKYSSLEAGVRAYCALLSKTRYNRAKEQFSHDPGRYITYVWASGYATSPNYPNIIMSIMRRIAQVTGDASYNVNADPNLQEVLAKMQAVKFGHDRMAVRDQEMTTLFGMTIEDTHEEEEVIPSRDDSTEEPLAAVGQEDDPEYLNEVLGVCIDPGMTLADEEKPA